MKTKKLLKKDRVAFVKDAADAAELAAKRASWKAWEAEQAALIPDPSAP